LKKDKISFLQQKLTRKMYKSLPPLNATVSHNTLVYILECNSPDLFDSRRRYIFISKVKRDEAESLFKKSIEKDLRLAASFNLASYNGTPIKGFNWPPHIIADLLQPSYSPNLLNQVRSDIERHEWGINTMLWPLHFEVSEEGSGGSRLYFLTPERREKFLDWIESVAEDQDWIAKHVECEESIQAKSIGRMNQCYIEQWGESVEYPNKTIQQIKDIIFETVVLESSEIY
jgi:hypothetical protein